MQNINIYHQTDKKLFLKNKTKIMEINNFNIDFNVTDIKIALEKLIINYYTFDLTYPIVKISMFYSFFPRFLDYHFLIKFMVDNNYRDKYLIDFAIKKSVSINFEHIIININDSCISSSSILLANETELREAEKTNSVIEYLKKIKKDLLTLEIKKFKIETESFFEKITRKTIMQANNIDIEEEDNYIHTINMSNLYYYLKKYLIYS
jgi:hypothetical protein